MPLISKDKIIEQDSTYMYLGHFEKDNECFVYLKLTQFTGKVESFVCYRVNIVYLIP